jgi:quercetin dioxygenase-like cupin family protein
MNIKNVNSTDKGVAAKILFKTETANATAISIVAGELLKEHITKTNAFLVCIFGEVLFENEQSESITLKAGDFLEIEAMVKHWVKGVATSHLILIK